MNLPPDLNLKYKTLYNQLYSADDATIQRCIETFYELCEKSRISPQEYEKLTNDVANMTTDQKRDLMGNYLCTEAVNRDFIAYITTGQSPNVCDHLLQITSALGTN